MLLSLKITLRITHKYIILAENDGVDPTSLYEIWGMIELLPTVASQSWLTSMHELGF